MKPDIDLSYAKMPPSNVEMEESILAGCLFNPDCRQDAITYVGVDDFYKTSHRKIFQTISEMTERGEDVDLVTVADALRNKKELNEIGGAHYLASLVDETPIPSNVKNYADKLKKYAQVRQIIRVCGNTMSQCYEQNIADLDEVINDFQKSALNIGQTALIPWKTKAEITQNSLERYQQLNEGSTFKAISTGFPLLDRYTGGGFRGPKLIIIAARPGVGKTALADNMMYHMCRRGRSVGYFSLEMDSGENDDRWISVDADVNTMKLYAEPGPDKTEWQRIIKVAEKQSDWRLFIDDTGGLKIGEIKRRARQMVRAGAEIIFIDQLSKIGGKRNLSRFDRNSEHVEELSFLKKELRIPIVLLAQLNRKLEERSNKRPILSDLKNTGQLEEDADIVLLGYRPGVYEEEEAPNPELAEWEIAKNRQGALKTIPMLFNRRRVKFWEEERIHTNYQDRD